MIERIGANIKAVFFDLDDTLLGTWESKWAQHKFIAATHYDWELTDELLNNHWGEPFEIMLKNIYGPNYIDHITAKGHIDLHRHKYPKTLFPGTIPALRMVKESGKLSGIITALGREGVNNDFDSHKIPRELLDYIQTSNDSEFHKPDPKVFDPVISWLNEKEIKAGEAVYIGDSRDDLQAALGAGFHFIGVQTGRISEDQFIALNVHSVPMIADVVSLLS